MKDATCDVVIATRHRPEPLRRALEGLLDQTHQGFGVVVVDDASDEPIRPIVEDDRFRPLAARVVTLPVPSGPAAARNAGVAASAAGFVVFLDDDVVPERHLVEVHMAAVRKGDGRTGRVVSCGPFVQPADWDDPTPWNLWEAHLAKREADDLSRGVYAPTWRQFHTGNNCLPVEVLRAVGGFDERFLRAEDDELALRPARAGCTFVFEPAAIAWHYSHRSLESWLGTARAYATFDRLIDRLHPEQGYLATKAAELQRRRLPLRVAREVLRHDEVRARAVRALVGLAQVAHRAGATGAAMGALSVAYDLTYTAALHAGGGDGSHVGSGQGSLARAR